MVDHGSVAVLSVSGPGARGKAREARRWRLRAVLFGPKATAPFVPSVHVAGRRFLPRSAMPILSMRLSDAKRGGSSATPMGHRACSPRVRLVTPSVANHLVARTGRVE